MTITITSACLKGGSGKSTVANTIATTLHARGHDVLVVDTDPQRTLLRWSGRAAQRNLDAPSVVAIDGEALRKELRKRGTQHDFIVIDCPPRQSRETLAAILAADLVLVPVSIGQGDLWALEETAELVEQLRGGAPDMVVRAVLNRAEGRTVLTRSMPAAVTRFFELLPASLANRVAYPEALAAGQGVTTHARGSLAAAEGEALTDAALAVLGEAA